MGLLRLEAEFLNLFFMSTFQICSLNFGHEYISIWYFVQDNRYRKELNQKYFLGLVANLPSPQKVAFFVLTVCSVLTNAASLMTLCLKAETGHQATQKKNSSLTIENVTKLN